MAIYLGIDFGTSGARAIAIDDIGQIRCEGRYDFETTRHRTADWTPTWREALFALLEQICRILPTPQDIARIAIDGTSSTVLLCDETGNPIETPILYDDDRGVAVTEILNAIAPANHPVLSATSSLAKLLWWLTQNDTRESGYFLHQADWLAFLLHGKLGITDYHNVLKLGADVEKLCYPDWLYRGLEEGFDRLASSKIPRLPQIVAPGTPIGPVLPDIARRFHLADGCTVCAGTTDSIAAFLASGASGPGEAVTSLGSTLVLKLLSRTRVDDARYGIYSHRLGDLWLAGGASNTGGAVLRQFFSDRELTTLSRQLPNDESPLNYYPLTQPGERFPICDPQLPPRLEPKPDDPIEFLHGLLDGMAKIEGRGYQLLQQLGGTALKRVYTAGGGARNRGWTRLRQRCLGVSVFPSMQTEAAYGTALLAMRSIKPSPR
ncbi:MAG: FGGY-family carbohydrate kinase [Cyanobacteriota bacterium]|nr:FGGY-family carbohydrate kinase [Cyanobacteriota bacterium]